MNLFYRSSGNGTPVVILHGLYGSSDNWMQIARMLPDTYRTIAVDLRNHGASPHATSHSYPEMVTDLAWLFHELSIEKAHLLGHSMGGKVAIAFANDYPEKILSLTVADIAPKNYLRTPASAIQYDFHQRILKVLNEMDLSKFVSRKDVENQMANAIPEKLVRQFLIKNLHRVHHQFEWKINVKVLQQSLDHIINGVDAEEFDDRIPMLHFPVLFIKGALSGYIQDADHEIIKKMYPEASIETISDATHFLHVEKPEEFVSIFTTFINKVKVR